MILLEDDIHNVIDFARACTGWLLFRRRHVKYRDASRDRFYAYLRRERRSLGRILALNPSSHARLASEPAALLQRLSRFRSTERSGHRLWVASPSLYR